MMKDAGYGNCESARGRLPGGWEAPCETFDYGEMAGEAWRECRAIQERLRLLKAQVEDSAEGELLRRRSVRMLTDMYYEQRGNAQLFEHRAAGRTSS